MATKIQSWGVDGISVSFDGEFGFDTTEEVYAFLVAMEDLCRKHKCAHSMFSRNISIKEREVSP
jgi:hypothetical protein